MAAEDEKQLARIFLRSGQVIEFRCTKLTTKKHNISGQLLSIAWEGADDAPLYLDASDVVAVQ